MFSTRAVCDAPRESKVVTRIMTIIATRSINPPLSPVEAVDNALGKLNPTGEINPWKLAESPEATNATAMKYSANKAQPQSSPRIHQRQR